MPVRIARQGSRYRVSHGSTVSARSTTKRKARRQTNLLRGLEHGWHPTGKKAR